MLVDISFGFAPVLLLQSHLLARLEDGTMVTASGTSLGAMIREARTA